MSDLFDQQLEKQKEEKAPLAERMRPTDFNHFYGQDDLVGEETPLRKAIENNNLSSIILWGPPGSGKTTLAKIIAKKTDAHFKKFSAVEAKIKEVRKTIKKAKERLKMNGKTTIVFIDEVHRFTKTQQDALLPHVEEGTIILIGATTENPSFEVISPLLSRSSVYTLDPLSKKDLKKVLRDALEDKERGLGGKQIKVPKKVLERIINFSSGDARVALNILEMAINFVEEKEELTFKDLEKVLEKKTLRYDKEGEKHYNLISAFIKSMRDSQSSAALYWLARMIESGEDPNFIVRRMVIFASEDVGNEDPQALEVATSVARAVEYVGLPEAEINLAQGAAYLSEAPKNDRSYSALLKAKEDAKKGSFGVPKNLRNATTDLTKRLEYGKGYKYAHDDEEGAEQQNHFPKKLGERNYFENKS